MLILIGAVLLNLPIASRDGQSIGFINALFTATSAVCVTGLVVADTYTQFNIFGQLMILILIQFGGTGNHDNGHDCVSIAWETHHVERTSCYEGSIKSV